jgi:hypothetical protein
VSLHAAYAPRSAPEPAGTCEWPLSPDPDSPLCGRRATRVLIKWDVRATEDPAHIRILSCTAHCGAKRAIAAVAAGWRVVAL